MDDVAVVTAAARTGSTGTQDFTVSGFGTPVGALFFVSYGVSAGTAVDHAMLCVGGTDGTSSKANAGRAQDAATGATSHESTTLPIITLLNSSGATDGLAAFDSWITDGIRVNWTDVPPAAYLITCVLFGGSGVPNCKVGQFASGAVIGSGVDITSPGFTPDIVFVGVNGKNQSFNDGANSNFGTCFGVCVNDGSATQKAVGFQTNGGANPSANFAVVSSTRIARDAASGGGGLELQCQDFDANGFSLIVRTQAAEFEGWYMALKLNGIRAKVLTTASPTTTGAGKMITGVGWTPQFGMLVHSAALAVDTVYTDTSAEVFGISAFTAAAQGSAAVYCQDNVNPFNTESISDTKPVQLRRGAAAFQTATFTAFNADGVEFNYSVTDTGNAHQRLALFIEQGAAAPDAFVKVEIRAAP